MNRSILKPIIFGVLFGAAAFFAPFFLLKAVLFIMIIGLICRMFWWRRGGWNHYRQYHMAYADNIRNMTPEQYAEFKAKGGNDNCYSGACCGWEQKNEARTAGNESAVDKK
jgi:hypothetical protein